MALQLLVVDPTGHGLLPEVFAVLALAVLIYGLRDAWRGVRQWLRGSESDTGGAVPFHAETEASAVLSAEPASRPQAGEAAPPLEPAVPSGALTAARASARAAGVIARALAEAQLIISAEHQLDAQRASAVVAEALGRCEAIIVRIAGRMEQLSQRVENLSEAIAALASHTHPPGRSTEPLRPMEPSFEPDAQGITLVVSGTSGFQALMGIQHALARLPQTRSAAVLRYEHDEAEFHLVLGQAMTAAAIADAVAAADERRLLIEESAPAGRRLRLRFGDV